MSKQVWKVTMMTILTAAAFSTAQAAPGGDAKGERVGEGPRGKMREMMLKKYDADGDGVLSDTEKAAMEAAHKEMLAKYDTDKDGKLSEAERAAIPKPERGPKHGKAKDAESSEE